MPYAAFTAAAPAEPAALLASLPATSKLRGNPNSAHAPAQPARGLDPRGTRTGCPCRSPAIHGKLRCPAGQARGQAPHGGRSPGPRVPETLPRQRRGQVSRCATSAPSMAPLVQTRAPRTTTAALCCTSAWSASPSTATRPTCRRRPPPPARGTDARSNRAVQTIPN